MRTPLLLRAVGRVNMVGADHVGVLVFNMFNVSIGRENIRKDLRFVDTVRADTGRCTGWRSLMLTRAGVWR